VLKVDRPNFVLSREDAHDKGSVEIGNQIRGKPVIRG